MGRARSSLPLAARAHVHVRPCDKVPLLAPGGTVISLFATANTVPVNGEIEIVATAIENGTTVDRRQRRRPQRRREPRPRRRLPRRRPSTSTSGAGTPVQNGTVITFTTTLGRIEPADARTNNGQVRVRFIFERPERHCDDHGVLRRRVSQARESPRRDSRRRARAAERDTAVLPPSGGTTEIAARVEDTSGAGLAGRSGHLYGRSRGSSVPGPSLTDSNGVAKTTSRRRRARRS